MVSADDLEYGCPCLCTFSGQLYAVWISGQNTHQYTRCSVSDFDSKDTASSISSNWISPQAMVTPHGTTKKQPISAIEFGEYLMVSWVQHLKHGVYQTLGTPTAGTN